MTTRRARRRTRRGSVPMTVCVHAATRRSRSVQPAFRRPRALHRHHRSGDGRGTGKPAQHHAIRDFARDLQDPWAPARDVDGRYRYGAKVDAAVKMDRRVHRDLSAGEHGAHEAARWPGSTRPDDAPPCPSLQNPLIPAPSPTTTRPCDASCSVARHVAVIAGCRTNGSVTHGPSRAVRVRRATAVSVTMTSHERTARPAPKIVIEAARLRLGGSVGQLAGPAARAAIQTLTLIAAAGHRTINSRGAFERMSYPVSVTTTLSSMRNAPMLKS